MLSLYYRLSTSRYLWWAVFGSFKQLDVPAPPLVAAERIGRKQERFPVSQSRARKRRAAVQRMRSTAR